MTYTNKSGRLERDKRQAADIDEEYLEIESKLPE